jgi:hypothetical protein
MHQHPGSGSDLPITTRQVLDTTPGIERGAVLRTQFIADAFDLAAINGNVGHSSGHHSSAHQHLLTTAIGHFIYLPHLFFLHHPRRMNDLRVVPTCVYETTHGLTA